MQRIHRIRKVRDFLHRPALGSLFLGVFFGPLPYIPPKGRKSKALSSLGFDKREAPSSFYLTRHA